jgi:hypothetical protein
MKGLERAKTCYNFYKKSANLTVDIGTVPLDPRSLNCLLSLLFFLLLLFKARFIVTLLGLRSAVTDRTFILSFQKLQKLVH